MNVHQLIEPAAACRRLKHRLEERPRAVGAGHYEYCYTCSLGFEMAMLQLDNEQVADEFVRFLRT